MTSIGLFPAIVYVLCLATSSACALLLGRSFRRTRNKLLLWSAVCFVLLAANNLFVIIDIILVPMIDFAVLRLLLSLGAVSVLLFGFIWDLEEEA